MDIVQLMILHEWQPFLIDYGQNQFSSSAIDDSEI